MASEVVALCTSFEQEFSKVLAVLPPASACGPDNHDAHLNHHRLSQRIAESVAYYAGRLPAFASVPRILGFGFRLQQLQQHQLALQACYKHVRALGLHETQESLPRMDALTRLSSHVQACFGCAACEAALLLLADPHVKHPDTLQWLVQCLAQLRDAIGLALPDERLYWLVLNGSVHVYATAKALTTAGFAEQALPALVYCIKAMEGHVCFAAPKYLPWRTQLYTWAVYGLVDCGAHEQARALLADGLRRIDQLVSLQRLDPVPPAPAVRAAFTSARAALLGLQLRVEVAAGAPVTPVLAQLSAGAAAAAAAPAAVGGGGGGAEAGDLLVKAQAAEDGLFAAMQPDLRARRDSPHPPKLLQRTPTSVTLVAQPPGPGLKAPPGARKPPVQYIAYCKSYGAGVGLSINKTATEYPGSGVMAPLGQPVTVQGLRANDTYLFAVALYDEDGGVVGGGLGASTPEVLLALPLPLYACWAQLLAAAVRARAWVAAKRAAGVLLHHMVVSGPDAPIWAANPMDSQRLHRAHVAAAARPLLRSVVQGIYMYGGAALLRNGAAAAGGGAGAAAAPAAPLPQVALPCTLPQLRAPFLQEQVARLKAARLLVLGMEVAALLPDEPLMQEGALRTYHLLAPLLALRAPRSPLLHKALAACHAVLSSLTNLVQDSLHRQEAQRALASRVAAAVSYQLLRLSDEAGEAGAAAHFGRLQVELLKAYDPRFTIAGRPAPAPTDELQPEASELHDVLLQHPRLGEWAPEPLLERQKDAADLPARVLPMLAGGAPMEAWGAALGFETAAEHP
ncbi:hypothetical protein TSOC_012750, partial [Tetrabaena socialis]